MKRLCFFTQYSFIWGLTAHLIRCNGLMGPNWSISAASCVSQRDNVQLACEAVELHHVMIAEPLL